jgi:transposase
MYKIPRQSYTEEFKREAVRLVQNGHKPSAVARQLGISEQTLANWRKAAGAGKLAGTSKKVTPEEMEFSRLRAENQRLKMENEILKKAAAYFAKESL